MGYKDYFMICDLCGFRYHRYEMKESSYGTWQCTECHDGMYDISNHPQNFSFDDFSDPQPLTVIREDVSLAVASVTEEVALSVVLSWL